MAKVSTLTLSVVVTGDGVSESFTPPGTPILNAGAPYGGPVEFSLSTGDNTITVPSGAKGCIFAPPSTSTVVKKLKNQAGDSGSPISTAGPWFYGFAGVAPASFIINAASAETISLQFT